MVDDDVLLLIKDRLDELDGKITDLRSELENLEEIATEIEYSFDMLCEAINDIE